MEIQTKKGKWPIGQFVTARLYDCKYCTNDLPDFNHTRCVEFLYGMKGFGTHYYDTVCDCPHHKGNKAFIETAKQIDNAIENEIDFIEESERE